LDVSAAGTCTSADADGKYATNYFGIRYGAESAYHKAAFEGIFQELRAIAAEHRLTLEKAKNP
jgi:hypothetical protein